MPITQTTYPNLRHNTHLGLAYIQTPLLNTTWFYFIMYLLIVLEAFLFNLFGQKQLFKNFTYLNSIIRHMFSKFISCTCLSNSGISIDKAYGALSLYTHVKGYDYLSIWNSAYISYKFDIIVSICSVVYYLELWCWLIVDLLMIWFACVYSRTRISIRVTTWYTHC